ncbi:S8 family serine peptidase [Fulvivirga lutea]|uniref:S8 family serine peptidase n=1 Tax=Fulvivirga lutea TaxID=2810512 RepID=A0A974WGA0_9BACT|nr:S8 family serine peptidase [Fulvivirga lutea]QSE97309.1 S8 family serine peptidase [Fulvivirga lutea]
MNKFKLLIYALMLFAGTLRAQQKYWIYLKDKTASVEDIRNTANAFGTTPIVISDWLKAYSSNLSYEQINSLKLNAAIAGISAVRSHIITHGSIIEPFQIHKSLDQIKADTLIQMGINGKGIKIGIIDAGFLNADKNRYLKKAIEQGQVKGYKNYIDPELVNPFEGTSLNNDNHGTEVFQFIAGNSIEMTTGLATEATYYLARTDRSESEYHAEEDYWIAALEWMYSEGVRLVNSSLGYSDGFDTPDTDYLPENVDGKFSAITRATDIAINDKGMTIVLSAGNDGNKDFKIISIPADAKGSIAVGSTGYRYWDRLDYSSIGPEHLKMVKPDFSCYASGGTSFSAPIITGLIACMKQLKPGITNSEIINLLAKSSHLYPHPNNYLGYGVPDVNKLLHLMADNDQKVWGSEQIQATDTLTIELPKSYNIMSFHKKNSYIVLKQEKLRWRDNKVTVEQFEGAKFTTVTNGNKVWEIEWVD